jgi:hypothetical protein
MKKTISFAVVGLLFAAGSALADDKADAQAKVDAAKKETCEKVVKFLGGQEAKCPDEAAEAKKLTCTAATFAKANDLNAACMKKMTAKPADKGAGSGDKPADKGAGSAADKPADKPAETAGVPKCRALDLKDNKVVIEEAEDKLATKCIRLLGDKLQKHWCSAENKGKKFDYMTDYDQTVGTGAKAKKIAGKKATYTCHTVNK